MSSNAAAAVTGEPLTVHGSDQTRTIGGVKIHVATEQEAIAALCGDISSRSGVWTFANAHTINLARSDPAFLACLADMSVLNDGAGVELASRLLYKRAFPANLNGTDLTPRLLTSVPAGTRIFLLGGAPGIAERASENLKVRYPSITIAGLHDGFFGAEQNDAIVAGINRSDAALVLVAMGQPRQERWAMANANAVNATLLCVGAFLDFAAGKVPRAPAVIQRARMEWAYRLAIEPRRLARRYLIGNATFLWAVLREWRERRVRG